MNEAKIHVGDALEVLRTMDADSFDACLSDPPYGLKFMGKRWDHGVPSVEVWAEVLRVLKPGAMLLAFGGTRTHHRLMVAIEDAGFQIRDCMMYLYGSGFPKSHDISKAIDKVAGAEREVVGRRTSRQPTGNAYAQDEWTKTAGEMREIEITSPATHAAERWSGYGTALKPAWEPIVLAMKPLDGTFAGNALAHGVAGLNIDGVRVNATGERLGGGAEKWTRHSDGWHRPWMDDPEHQARKAAEQSVAVEKATKLGRWPANLLLDEESGALLDEQSGESESKASQRGTLDEPFKTGDGTRYESTLRGHEDSGGASRFFYTAKADPAERNIGGGDCNHPTLKPIDLTAYLARLILPPERDTPRRLLVPFAGAGSEIIGALRAGWDEVTGIEIEAEYVEIAERRITGDAPLLNTVEVLSQVTS